MDTNEMTTKVETAETAETTEAKKATRKVLPDLLFTIAMIIGLATAVWQTIRGSYILALGDLLFALGVGSAVIVAHLPNHSALGIAVHRVLTVAGLTIVICGLLGYLPPQRQYYVTYDYVIYYGQAGESQWKTTGSASMTVATDEITNRNLDDFIDDATQAAFRQTAEHFKVPESHIEVGITAFSPIGPS